MYHFICRIRVQYRYSSFWVGSTGAPVLDIIIGSRGRAHGRSIDGTISQAAGMQSWIRDLIDLKTQISVLQNCMQQPASSHAAPASHYRVADKSEPWTGGSAAIDPATAWPNGLLRQRPGYLRLLPHPVSRPGGSQTNCGSGRRKYTFLYIIVPESWL